MERDHKETTIKSALESIHTPEFDIAKGIQKRMERRRRMFSGKRFIAAAIALCLVVFGVAVAQSANRVDLIRGMFGNDVPELILPSASDEDFSLSVSQEDFLPGASGEDSPARSVITPSSIITDDGFKIWMTTQAFYYNAIDIYMMLQDLEGDRLGEDFIVIYSFSAYNGRFASTNLLHMHQQFSYARGRNYWPRREFEFISRDEDGVVTLRARQVFIGSAHVRSISLNIFHVLHGWVLYEDTKLPIDFGAIDHSPPTSLFILPEVDSGAEWTFSHKDSYRPVDNTFPILTPHQLNFTPFEEIEISISSIGIIDGRLHVQHKFTIGEESNYLSYDAFLVGPDGVRRQPVVSAVFDTIDGDYMYWSGVTGPIVGTVYVEGVFEINLAQLSEYRLFVNAHSAENILPDWRWPVVLFNVDADAREIVVSDLDIPRFDFTVTEIRINPFALMLIGVDPRVDEEGQFMEYDFVFDADDVIEVHLTTGEFRLFQGMGATIGGEVTMVHYFDHEFPEGFLDIGTVTKIVIGGAVIEMP